MCWNFYIIGHLVIIPTSSITEHGLYLETEPVATGSLNETEDLVRKIVEKIEQGNPRVPAPQHGAFPKPVVLRYAKAKSWSAFERSAALWSITKEDHEFIIGPCARAEDRGWLEDPSRMEKISGTVSLESVARRLVALMQGQTT